jgi:thioredoxin-related protein
MICENTNSKRNRMLSKKIYTALICLFFSGLITAQKEMKSLEIGDKAPMINQLFKGVDGASVSLSSIVKENGYIVIFSCNTCPYVIGGETFPGWEKQYNSLSEKASAAKLGIVLVNSNTAKRREGDGMEDMVLRSKEMNYQIPYVLDQENSLADAFGAKTTPHIFMFDDEHTLIYEGAIDNSWDPRIEENEVATYVLDAIEAVKLNKEISLKKTAPKGCSIKRK